MPRPRLLPPGRGAGIEALIHRRFVTVRRVAGHVAGATYDVVMNSCLLTGAAAQERFDEILRELGSRLMLAMLRDAGRSRIVEVRIALRLSEIGVVAEMLQRRGTETLKDSLSNAAIGDSPAAQFGMPELEGITWWESPRDWDILVTVEDAPGGYATDVVATAEKAVAYDSPVSGYGTDPR